MRQECRSPRTRGRLPAPSRPARVDSRPVVRRGVGAALILSAAGCGRPPVPLAPVPPGLGVASSLFLIGDAGAALPGDRVLAELVRQGRTADRSSAIVFLGDNVYPRGIPRPESPEYPEAERRLLSQAALADSTGLRVFLVPGNHDWDRQGPDGWAAIRRQEALLRKYAETRRVPVDLVPKQGCPGPAVVTLEAFRVVALDTQWWLHGHAKPGPGTAEAVECAGVTAQAVTDSLERIGPDQARSTVVVAHHPLASNGEHAGRFGWTDYVFPFVPTPIAPWAWLPIGWIYPLGRRLLGHPQDLFSSTNRAMRKAIVGTFPKLRPLVYASGHDHSLQVIRREEAYVLVSGAGIEEHETEVARGQGTAYSSDRPGFMRLDRLSDGRIRLAILELVDRGMTETYSGLLDPLP